MAIVSSGIVRGRKNKKDFNIYIQYIATYTPSQQVFFVQFLEKKLTLELRRKTLFNNLLYICLKAFVKISHINARQIDCNS